VDNSLSAWVWLSGKIADMRLRSSAWAYGAVTAKALVELQALPAHKAIAEAAACSLRSDRRGRRLQPH
jgi:hypothetical protein